MSKPKIGSLWRSQKTKQIVKIVSICRDPDDGKLTATYRTPQGQQYGITLSEWTLAFRPATDYDIEVSNAIWGPNYTEAEGKSRLMSELTPEQIAVKYGLKQMQKRKVLLIQEYELILPKDYEYMPAIDDDKLIGFMVDNESECQFSLSVGPAMPIQCRTDVEPDLIFERPSIEDKENA